MSNANPRPTGPQTRPASAGFACVVAAWQAHEAQLRGYVRHRLGDEAAAQDIVQEVFLKAMSRENALCGVDNPRAWLFQVARNAMIDRARTAHPGEPIEEHEGELVGEPADATPAVETLAACVAVALQVLPVADAAILRACDIEGALVREFAAAHGLSLAGAKSRLLRARARLREHLVRECQVRFDAAGAVCCHAEPRSLPAGPAAS
jgi:RNA polymerase sigma-70 factor, ECF subfamily